MSIPGWSTQVCCAIIYCAPLQAFHLSHNPRPDLASIRRSMWCTEAVVIWARWVLSLHTFFYWAKFSISKSVCKKFGTLPGIIRYIKSTHLRMSMLTLLLLWSVRWPTINKDIMGVSEKVSCRENFTFLHTWVQLISTTFNWACYMKLSL